MRLLLRKGLALTAMGAIVGAACALAAGRVLRAYPFGVASTDPVTLIGAAAVLGAVATLACWLPARTACRVDPLTALKSD